MTVLVLGLVFSLEYLWVINLPGRPILPEAIDNRDG